MKSVTPDIGRRRFLGGMSLTLGGAAFLGWLPASLLEAAPAACLVNASAWPDACGDWQLDDICMAYPPFSHRVESPVPAAAAISAVVEPVDSHWVA